MSKRTAVVTIAYNEDVLLPLWVRYYARQFGEESCYVIDHGSDDESTKNLGQINVVRIPRSPMHDKKKAKFISNFHPEKWKLFSHQNRIPCYELIRIPDRFCGLI
jgi:exoribonuclease II